jgi:AraC-like DNA-binding protein
MRDHLSDAQHLSDHAQAAFLSPFHFHRVFRDVTSTTPSRFLAALRMTEAQRLLIQSSLRITDICAAVGYSSLGTFSTQFSRLVGVGPRHFRSLIDKWGDEPIGELADRAQDEAPPVTPNLTLEAVAEPGAPEGVVFIGVFMDGVPQDRPSACGFGRSKLIKLRQPPGASQMLGVWFDANMSVVEALDDPLGERRLVGAARICGPDMAGPPGSTAQLRLRRLQRTDPPVVLAVPLLRGVS